MKPTFFITGTDTGVGKTVLTALLAQFLRARGARAAALKPVCSGGRGDARALQAALAGALTLDEINPWHFRAALAPAAAAERERKPLKLAAMLAHLRATRERFEVTLVEGAGGLLSPLGEQFDSRDVIVALQASPIIVAPNRLGAVNQVRLTLAALPEHLRARARVVLMAPAKPDTATTSNAKLLGRYFPAEKIHSLPWLGGKFSPAQALKTERMKQTLAALLTI